MIFAAVLSPTIKIFHRHLGPNLYIFAVKVSPWFHQHFTVILWHITDISPRKNTDQDDFLLKRAVRAVIPASTKIWKIKSKLWGYWWTDNWQHNMTTYAIPASTKIWKIKSKHWRYWTENWKHKMTTYEIPGSTKIWKIKSKLWGYW